MIDKADPNDQPAITAGDPAEAGIGESSTLEHWMCGAKNRQGKPYRGPKSCKFHGGKSLRGAASPSFKNGSRSRSFAASLPPKLRDKFETALADPELLSLRSYVALLDARVADAIERYCESDAAQFRDRLQKLWKQLEQANAEKDIERVAELLKGVGEVIRLGAAEEEAWSEVAAAIKDLVAVTTQENRRLVDMGMMLNVEQAMALVVTLHFVVAEHVKDKSVLNAIGIDLESKLGLIAPR